MPIYDYKCSKCGHVFEILQNKVIDIEKCEKCGAKAKRVAANRVGFVFKGSGFYVNDYKKSGSTGSTAVKSGPEGSTRNTAAGNGSKESKPAQVVSEAASEPKKEKKVEKKETKGGK